MRMDQILKLNPHLLDNATQVDILEALQFRLQVAKGLKDVAECRLVSHTLITKTGSLSGGNPLDVDRCGRPPSRGLV